MNNTNKKNLKIIRAVTVSQSTGLFKPIIKDLQTKGFDVVSLSSPGPELLDIESMGVKVINVQMRRHISLFRDIISLLSIIRILKKEKPFIVHSMTPKAGMLCMLASWITRVPRRIHTFTGLVWPTAKGIKKYILMATDWITCACATNIIPEGQGVMNDLQRHITKKSMRVLGYGNVRGIDLVRFNHRNEIQEASQLIKKEDVFSFLFVGRIVGDKGINELVEAFVHLSKEYDNIRLFLVGKLEDNLDPINDATHMLIQETKNIHYVGPKYEDELLAYYEACDCFVFPSYREGFPNTVMEAGAMGLPSIVTDINGSREIIENGINGVIIPSKDSNALYKAMRQMLENKDDYRFMAQNARPMIESRFEQGFVCKCLLDYYDELIISNK